MKTRLPIILVSKDGQFFRKIYASANPDADCVMEKKTLGLPWEAHDEPTIAAKRVDGYVETMTKRLGWKAV